MPTETWTKARFFTGFRKEVFTFTVNLQGIHKGLFTFAVNLQVFARPYCGLGKTRVATVTSRFVETKWHVSPIFSISHERCRLFGGVISLDKKR